MGLLYLVGERRSVFIICVVEAVNYYIQVNIGTYTYLPLFIFYILHYYTHW